MSCLLCCFKTLSLCGFRDCLTNSTAFRPPTQRVYELKKDRHDLVKGPIYKMILKNQNGSSYEPQDHEGLESSVVWLSTKTNKQIPALFIDNKRTDFVILYSHGNSTDLGRMFTCLQDLSAALNVHIFAYEYNGYGPTKGSVSEYDIIFGIFAAYEFLTQRLGFKWNNIVLYGRSIGTGPTVYLASHPRYPVSGVILHSPIASGLRVFNFEVQKTDKRDIFPNCDFIEYVKAHVFIIHGESDAEVPIAHGQLLASKCKNLYSPWWVSEGGHNDIDFKYTKAYFLRIAKFLKYVRDFNLDKPIQELEDFYKVAPWADYSKHIYAKTVDKIEEKYRREMLKNGKKSLKDQSHMSGSSLLTQKSLKNRMLDLKEESSSLPQEDLIENQDSGSQDNVIADQMQNYMPPKLNSKSLSLKQKSKVKEIEFHSQSFTTKPKELEFEEEGRKTIQRPGDVHMNETKLPEDKVDLSSDRDISGLTSNKDLSSLKHFV